MKEYDIDDEDFVRIVNEIYSKNEKIQLYLNNEFECTSWDGINGDILYDLIQIDESNVTLTIADRDFPEHYGECFVIFSLLLDEKLYFYRCNGTYSSWEITDWTKWGSGLVYPKEVSKIVYVKNLN